MAHSRTAAVYGHWIQGIPQEYRKRLRIDHEQATELDYVGLHINMLYCPLMWWIDTDGKQVDMTRRHILLVVSLEAGESRPDFVSEGNAKFQWQPEKANAQESRESERILSGWNADDNTGEVCRDRHVAIEIAVADVAAKYALESMAPSRIGHQMAGEGMIVKGTAEEIACEVVVFGFEGHKRHSPINEDFSPIGCLPASFH